MTKIVATIGPASADIDTLVYFSEHNVEIARQNFSHGTPEWHIENAVKIRQAGMKILNDLPGPKIRLGDFDETNIVTIKENELVALELQVEGKTYPFKQTMGDNEMWVFPSALDLTKYLAVKKDILIDDGKVHIKTEMFTANQAICRVIFGGKIKSRKSLNLPGTDIKVDFLTPRDRKFLTETLAIIRPEYVATSFVKTVEDVRIVKAFIQEILDENGVKGYYPLICTKVEMGEAVETDSLNAIIDESDIIMVARGDLALEINPLHIGVPFLQEKIKKACNAKGKPFIVATQILETMTECPVPTRAEISDLYRAVFIDKADYVMLSGESAAGQFPRKCVHLMSEMVTHNAEM